MQKILRNIIPGSRNYTAICSECLPRSWGTLYQAAGITQPSAPSACQCLEEHYTRQQELYSHLLWVLAKVLRNIIPSSRNYTAICSECLPRSWGTLYQAAGITQPSAPSACQGLEEHYTKQQELYSHLLRVLAKVLRNIIPGSRNYTAICSECLPRSWGTLYLAAGITQPSAPSACQGLEEHYTRQQELHSHLLRVLAKVLRSIIPSSRNYTAICSECLPRSWGTLYQAAGITQPSAPSACQGLEEHYTWQQELHSHLLWVLAKVLRSIIPGSRNYTAICSECLPRSCGTLYQAAGITQPYAPSACQGLEEHYTRQQDYTAICSECLPRSWGTLYQAAGLHSHLLRVLAKVLRNIIPSSRNYTAICSECLPRSWGTLYQAAGITQPSAPSACQGLEEHYTWQQELHSHLLWVLAKVLRNIIPGSRNYTAICSECLPRSCGALYQAAGITQPSALSACQGLEEHYTRQQELHSHLLWVLAKVLRNIIPSSRNYTAICSECLPRSWGTLYQAAGLHSHLLRVLAKVLRNIIPSSRITQPSALSACQGLAEHYTRQQELHSHLLWVLAKVLRNIIPGSRITQPSAPSACQGLEEHYTRQQDYTAICSECLPRSWGTLYQAAGLHSHLLRVLAKVLRSIIPSSRNYTAICSECLPRSWGTLYQAAGITQPSAPSACQGLEEHYTKQQDYTAICSECLPRSWGTLYQAAGLHSHLLRVLAKVLRNIIPGSRNYTAICSECLPRSWGTLYQAAGITQPSALSACQGLEEHYTRQQELHSHLLRVLAKVLRNIIPGSRNYTAICSECLPRSWGTLYLAAGITQPSALSACQGLEEHYTRQQELDSHLLRVLAKVLRNIIPGSRNYTAICSECLPRSWGTLYQAVGIIQPSAPSACQGLEEHYTWQQELHSHLLRVLAKVLRNIIPGSRNYTAICSECLPRSWGALYQAAGITQPSALSACQGLAEHYTKQQELHSHLLRVLAKVLRSIIPGSRNYTAICSECLPRSWGALYQAAGITQPSAPSACQGLEEHYTKQQELHSHLLWVLAKVLRSIIPGSRNYTAICSECLPRSWGTLYLAAGITQPSALSACQGLEEHYTRQQELYSHLLRVLAKVLRSIIPSSRNYTAICSECSPRSCGTLYQAAGITQPSAPSACQGLAEHYTWQQELYSHLLRVLAKVLRNIIPSSRITQPSALSACQGLEEHYTKQQDYTAICSECLPRSWGALYQAAGLHSHLLRVLAKVLRNIIPGSRNYTAICSECLPRSWGALYQAAGIIQPSAPSACQGLAEHYTRQQELHSHLLRVLAKVLRNIIPGSRNYTAICSECLPRSCGTLYLAAGITQPSAPSACQGLEEHYTRQQELYSHLLRVLAKVLRNIIPGSRNYTAICSECLPRSCGTLYLAAGITQPSALSACQGLEEHYTRQQDYTAICSECLPRSCGTLYQAAGITQPSALSACQGLEEHYTWQQELHSHLLWVLAKVLRNIIPGSRNYTAICSECLPRSWGTLYQAAGITQPSALSACQGLEEHYTRQQELHSHLLRVLAKVLRNIIPGSRNYTAICSECLPRSWGTLYLAAGITQPSALSACQGLEEHYTRQQELDSHLLRVLAKVLRNIIPGSRNYTAICSKCLPRSWGTLYQAVGIIQPSAPSACQGLEEHYTWQQELHSHLLRVLAKVLRNIIPGSRNYTAICSECLPRSWGALYQAAGITQPSALSACQGLEEHYTWQQELHSHLLRVLAKVLRSIIPSSRNYTAICSECLPRSCRALYQAAGITQPSAPSACQGLEEHYTRQQELHSHLLRVLAKVLRNIIPSSRNYTAICSGCLPRSWGALYQAAGITQPSAPSACQGLEEHYTWQQELHSHLLWVLAKVLRNIIPGSRNYTAICSECLPRSWGALYQAAGITQPSAPSACQGLEEHYTWQQELYSHLLRVLAKVLRNIIPGSRNYTAICSECLPRSWGALYQAAGLHSHLLWVLAKVLRNIIPSSRITQPSALSACQGLEEHYTRQQDYTAICSECLPRSWGTLYQAAGITQPSALSACQGLEEHYTKQQELYSHLLRVLAKVLRNIIPGSRNYTAICSECLPRSWGTLYQAAGIIQPSAPSACQGLAEHYTWQQELRSHLLRVLAKVLRNIIPGSRNYTAICSECLPRSWGTLYQAAGIIQPSAPSACQGLEEHYTRQQELYSHLLRVLAKVLRNIIPGSRNYTAICSECLPRSWGALYQAAGLHSHLLRVLAKVLRNIIPGSRNYTAICSECLPRSWGTLYQAAGITQPSALSACQGLEEHYTRQQELHSHLLRVLAKVLRNIIPSSRNYTAICSECLHKWDIHHVRLHCFKWRWIMLIMTECWIHAGVSLNLMQWFYLKIASDDTCSWRRCNCVFRLYAQVCNGFINAEYGVCVEVTSGCKAEEDQLIPAKYQNDNSILEKHTLKYCLNFARDTSTLPNHTTYPWWHLPMSLWQHQRSSKYSDSSAVAILVGSSWHSMAAIVDFRRLKSGPPLMFEEFVLTQKRLTNT